MPSLQYSGGLFEPVLLPIYKAQWKSCRLYMETGILIQLLVMALNNIQDFANKLLKHIIIKYKEMY